MSLLALSKRALLVLLLCLVLESLSAPAVHDGPPALSFDSHLESANQREAFEERVRNATPHDIQVERNALLSLNHWYMSLSYPSAEHRSQYIDMCRPHYYFLGRVLGVAHAKQILEEVIAEASAAKSRTDARGKRKGDDGASSS